MLHIIDYNCIITYLLGKSEKYSKNTENFLDALWLFECAIILKDRPTMLSILLNR